MGEEVPAKWDDAKPSGTRTSKPVPPGEYFTIVKGLSVAYKRQSVKGLSVAYKRQSVQ